MADRAGEKPAHHTYSPQELRDLQAAQLNRDVSAGTINRAARDEALRRQRAAEQAAIKAAEKAAKENTNNS